MASTAPRTPEILSNAHTLAPEEFLISELAADSAGAPSPFGTELQFPLPLDQLRYEHPGPAARPNLADGR